MGGREEDDERHGTPALGLFCRDRLATGLVNDPVAMKLLNKAGEMPSLEPPDDESIKTLYVGGLDARVTEQDLRDHFYAHGEIEAVRMVLQRACAFVTYTTREGAEKAAEELSNKLVIKGLRLKLMWGRPQAPKPEMEGSDGARQQAAVAHSGMLPRAVVSQQQNQLQPPGSVENKTDSEKQQPVQQHFAYQAMPPPPGQFHQPFYPSYRYMPPPPPPYQQYPPPYHSTMPPPMPPPPVPQQYQHSDPPGSSQN
ncbi:CCCH-type zinc fingerfamily protein with RNA-binding domain-containing protein [Actinidia rufa]|uniref:CCCH-type zinc fingerfamily protein with RNA-binding domain-containing protein n=1 Tax=Actinidia rufa TaxID=165716 RepID=A0A7J0HAW6_9ERIC|nr:CCCH-type zinc fingerfamily protein with RNA-binding domain-containing protein [Actinidia rufa]